MHPDILFKRLEEAKIQKNYLPGAQLIIDYV